MQPNLDKSGPYFRGRYGEKHFFADIARRIHEEHPELLGEHISIQLEALGLHETMRKGTTPFALPFSFAEAVE